MTEQVEQTEQVEKLTFVTQKEEVNGHKYPAQGTGARYVWDRADDAFEKGINSTDLMDDIVNLTDMTRGTVSSQLTYWRKETGKTLPKKIDIERAEREMNAEALKQQKEEEKLKAKQEKEAKREIEKAKNAIKRAEDARKKAEDRVEEAKLKLIELGIDPDTVDLTGEVTDESDNADEAAE